MIKLKLSQGAINEVRMQVRQFEKNLEKALVNRLEYVLEELKTHAKSNAGYNFQTGNLNSSIGGAVYKNGIPIALRGFEVESAGSEGSKVGLEYLNNLALKGRGSYVIVLVAGMEYASSVENLHNRNVLAKTEMVAGEKIEWAMQILKV